MQTLKRFLLRLLYLYGWDTRCRHVAPARVLNPIFAGIPPETTPQLLDVGSGQYGLATFLKDVSVVGTDLEPPTEIPGHLFLRSDITALPFPDRSFPVVSCIDVLEHLSLAQREQAVKELMRVASKAVLIACPHGPTAKSCDEQFRAACSVHGRPQPPWIAEHQRQPYPTTALITQHVQSASAASGRSVKVTLAYCEPARICRRVRAAAAASSLLYAGVNIVYGALLKLVPTPGAHNSYRMIVLVELQSP